MVKLSLALLMALFGTMALADGFASAQSREDFCARANDPDYFKKLISDTSNLVGFVNPAAGFFNGGLCWWHSQLQRSSLFLTVYRPDLPKPTDPEEIKHIFEAIMKQEAVVEIPGYSTFSDFTSDWQDLLTKLLSAWQVSQGVLGFGWLEGLGGTSESASALQKTMDDLYVKVETQKQIVFQVLKFPGLEAHSWLVVHMSKTDDGYHLQVLDSNFIGLQDWDYSQGMTNFTYVDGTSNFVPRTFRQGDLKDYPKLIKDYCSQKVDDDFKIAKVAGTDQVRQPQVGDPCEDEDGNKSTLINDADFGVLKCNITDDRDR